MKFSRSVIFAVLGGREKNTVAEKNEQQIKHGRGKKNGSEKNVLRGADCSPSTKYYYTVVPPVYLYIPTPLAVHCICISRDQSVY